MVVKIDNFFGVYLLNCVNPKFKGKTYIGFTVNPERRITQHNNGRFKGGAWKTDKKRPWKMVLIIHGFPSNIAALRFEWAWQHPKSSVRLRHVEKKARYEKEFDFQVRVLSEMLNANPWKRFPLTVQWLDQEYRRELCPEPPFHIPIAFGPVSAKTKKHDFDDANNDTDDDDDDGSQDSDENNDDNDDENEYVPLHMRIKISQQNPQKIVHNNSKSTCCLCKKSSNDLVAEEANGFYLSCLDSNCTMISHAKCLAAKFLKETDEDGKYLVPVQGTCPVCSKSLLWGNLLRKYNGFHEHFD